MVSGNRYPSVLIADPEWFKRYTKCVMRHDFDKDCEYCIAAKQASEELAKSEKEWKQTHISVIKAQMEEHGLTLDDLK